MMKGASPDSLPASSRAFYERSKAKCTFALLIFTCVFMILGFCSFSAGIAQSTNIYAKQAVIDKTPNELVMGMQVCVVVTLIGHSTAEIMARIGRGGEGR